MNNKLETIHQAFPSFVDGSFYIATPDNFFDDPENGIMIAVWGDKYKVDYTGPGEYEETIYDTDTEVIESVNKWLAACNE